MKKKLYIITAGLMVLCGLELVGIKTEYIDEIQSYLKVVIATFLASDSTSDILSVVKDLLAKNVDSKRLTD